MTEKDKQLIDTARHTPYGRWGSISALEEQADTQEAKEMLLEIEVYKFHLEESHNGDL